MALTLGAIFCMATVDSTWECRTAVSLKLHVL